MRDLLTPLDTEQRGALGVITLNRPEALNALTHEMVTGIAAALDVWEADASVERIAIVGAGDRALCAGGDVVGLQRDVIEGEPEKRGLAAAAFWRDEYAMNARIARYPKPIVAIQHGIVLGGGIGVSGHASHRVVTETSRLGFPEVTIGFVPDVGASLLLSRAPGELGTRLALTGEHVRAADAIAVGLSNAFVPAERIPELLSALETQDPDAALAALVADPEPSALLANRSVIDAAFAGDDLVAILQRLDDSDPETAARIRGKSPTAVATALASLRRARTLPDLESALVQEYRVSRAASLHPDFVEGVRAQLIDKDRDPHWSPATIAEVDPAVVDAAFAVPPEGDLELTRAY